MRRILCGSFTLLPLVAAAQTPATRPADPAVDFLLNAATTQPIAAPPTTAPASPLVAKDQTDQSRPAVMTLSDGRTLRGQASTTLDKPIRVWIEDLKDYRDVPFDQIRTCVASVVWERDEPEWNFIQSGSDVKVFTGKTYPARMTQYTFELASGDKFTGDVAAPIDFDDGQKSHLYVLHKRDKGDVGQKIGDLVYITSIAFDGATTKPATTAP